MLRFQCLLMALTLILTMHAHAGNGVLKYDEMNRFLDTLRASQALPARQLKIPAVPSNHEQVPAVAQQIFDHLQQIAFGKTNVVHLATCTDCAFQTEYAVLTVFIQPNEVAKIYQMYAAADAVSVLTATLAHELSHIIQEASIGIRGEPSKSLNGFKSLYVDDPAGYQQDPKAMVDAAIHAHAEVDAYAFLIMARGGMQKPKAMLSYLQSLIPKLSDDKYGDAWVVTADLKLRVEQDQVVMNQIWEN